MFYYADPGGLGGTSVPESSVSYRISSGQKVGKFKPNPPFLRGGATLKWRSLAEKAEYLRKSVNIALVGKYTGLDDAYCSVYNALYHASLACGRKLSLIKIESEDLEEVMQFNPYEVILSRTPMADHW